MKKKIVYFIPTLNDGGAERLVVEYCNLLDRIEFEPFLFTLFLSPDTSNYKRITKTPVVLHSVYGRPSFFKRFINKLFGFFIVPNSIKKFVIRNNVSIVHVHMALLSYLDVAKEFFKKKEIKLFYTCHSEPIVFFGGKNSKEYISCKRLIKNNHLRLIALHDKMKNELDSLFNVNDTVVIRNGVNPKAFSISKSKKEKRASIDVPVDAFVIGHIGRFDVPKNHSFLLSIFVEVLKLRENSHLLLVGDGPLADSIKKRITDLGIEKKVTVLSNRIDIVDLLNAMDVFVFPSLYEGLSVTLIEAQISGLSCIVSQNINSETFCTNQITSISLDEAPSVWAKNVVQPVQNVVPKFTKSDYDLTAEIHKLEAMYDS